MQRPPTPVGLQRTRRSASIAQWLIGLHDGKARTTLRTRVLSSLSSRKNGVLAKLSCMSTRPFGRRRTDDERVDVNGRSVSSDLHGRLGAYACLVSYWQ